VSARVSELAEKIKQKGQTSAAELPDLLRAAEQLAADQTLDERDRALALRAAGNAHQLLNQFQQALDSYNASAALLETTDDALELGRTLHAKVGMLFTLSRFDELFECSSRARQLFEQCSDRKRLARLDVNLSHAYHRLGRVKEALECSERALQVLQGTDDKEAFVAASINSAVTLTAMHEFERAQDRYRAAMEVAAERRMTSWVLLSRYNLAYLRYLDGDSATALEELRILRAEYERSNQEWMICQCWLDESEILLELGDLDDSIAAALRAGTAAKNLGLNSEIAKSLLYEAAARMRLGEGAEAGPLLDEAARRFASEGDQTSTAVAKLQTALLRSINGSADAALADALSAREVLRDSGLLHRRGLAEIVVGRIYRTAGNLEDSIKSFSEAMALAESSRSEWMQFHAAFELGLSLDSKDPSQSIPAFLRADHLLDSLWHRIGSDDLKMSFLGDRENVYTYLVRWALDDSPATAFNYSEKARSRVLRERLLGDVHTPPQALSSHLTPEEAIVEYFISGEDLYVFVLRRDGVTSIARPGVVSRVREVCRNFDRHIDSCSVKWEQLAAVRHHLQATAQHHLKDLYDELIAPVASELKGTVIFAPHGFLHGVPLHALYDGQQYLLDRVRVAYTPSASMYCMPDSTEPVEGPLFVAFCTTPESSSVSEIEEAASKVRNSSMLVNPCASELRNAFRAPRSLVHIAGHAGIDPIGGKFSWIATPQGKLTSRDLTDMQIRARTVVVTGCRTARRMIRPGDEWQGLMRSFYLSGASTILTALWDIRDEAARLFARRFYEVFDGQNALFAIQFAAITVRAQQGHPYFWSGFEGFLRKAA